MRQINRDSLRPYLAHGWTLIPLHPYTATRTKKGVTRKTGKAPRDSNWTVRPYDTDKIFKACVRTNCNMGVRLTSEQLVIDVDPRNGGDEGFTDLCLELGLDDSAFPRVITGSGGSHYYMSKPADVPVLDTLKDFPGVEFKSKGRQVVSAGSIHPDTKRLYVWDEAHPSLDELPPAPSKLLKFIRRPQRAAISGGGQYTQEQIAKMLDALDPSDFREQSAWLKLMMAVHHASDGDARPEFIEWSVSDPNYSDDAEVIGRRWDSLHREKNDGVTYKSLNYELEQRGLQSVIPARDASDDFGAFDDDETPTDDDSDDWLETAAPKKKTKAKKTADDDDGVAPENPGGLDDESSAELEKLNARYCFAIEGSNTRIIFEDLDPVMNRNYWVRMKRADFESLYSNRRVFRDTSGLSKNAAETMPMGKAWVEWPRRKTVYGVVFDPEREHEGRLNMWTGFKYEASKQGEWTRLQELIHEVLSNGDDEINDYILNWMAWLFQNPGKRAEAALVFRGGMGVGKGTLGNAIAETIGRHAMAISSPDLLVGRFNSHLQDVVFLFADEAIKPYDKTAESRLRAFITEPLLSFEGKGRDAIVGPNVLHLMMASNDSWLVPAGMDERRFLVSDANLKWQGKFNKFNALLSQLRADGGSGYQRLLFDCLNRDLPEHWHPRQLPTTKALIDQKIRSMSPLRQFLFNAVHDAVPPFPMFGGDWMVERSRCFAEDFRDAFRLYCRESNINPGGNGRNSLRFVFGELREIFPDAHTTLRDPVPDDSAVHASDSDNRAQSIELPSLPDCRKAFEIALRGPVDWPATDEEDFG